MFKTAEEAMQKAQDRISEIFRELPPIIGEEAVNFTIENFDAQGWQGDSFEPWQKRLNPNAWGKKDDTSRAILIKTAKLKRSIRVSYINKDTGDVYIQAGAADVPYARAHNEGFSGEVTQNVGEHIRKTKNLKNVKVSAFKRTIQQNIPKRKFIGDAHDSSQLRTRIRNAAIEHFKLRKNSL